MDGQMGVFGYLDECEQCIIVCYGQKRTNPHVLGATVDGTR
jgi:hypothetical protein